MEPFHEDEEKPVLPAWEGSLEGGHLRAFWKTLGDICLRPQETFRTLSQSRSLGAPLGYGLICVALSSALAAVVGRLFLSGVPEEARQLLVPAFGPQQVLFSILYFVVAVYIVAALYHLGLALTGGRSQPYATTFRVVAYVNGSMIALSWIPIFGWIVPFFWGIYLEIVGLREAHATTTCRTAPVVLIVTGLFWAATAAALLLTALHYLGSGSRPLNEI